MFILVHVHPHTQRQRGGMWSWSNLHVVRSSSSQPMSSSIDGFPPSLSQCLFQQDMEMENPRLNIFHCGSAETNRAGVVYLDRHEIKPEAKAKLNLWDENHKRISLIDRAIWANRRFSPVYSVELICVCSKDRNVSMSQSLSAVGMRVFCFILKVLVFTRFTLLLLDVREPHFPLHND